MPPCDSNIIFYYSICINNVSILVLVDAALRRGKGCRDPVQDTVSILVLVDAALRRHHVRPAQCCAFWFQSLF